MGKKLTYADGYGKMKSLSSKAKVNVEKFETLKQDNLDIKNIVSLEEIPPDLILSIMYISKNKRL